jgi:hypothetical protein
MEDGEGRLKLRRRDSIITLAIILLLRRMILNLTPLIDYDG